MTSREQHYLLDVLLAAEDALSFVRGVSLEEFEANALVRSAVLHCLAVIGEAAGRIAEASEVEVPGLPWRRMKNLRNVIIHDYEGVNLPVIWTIVTVELPQLVLVLRPLFPERTK